MKCILIKRISIFSATLLALAIGSAGSRSVQAATPALQSDRPVAMGFGVASMLTGPVGMAFTYDNVVWRADALLMVQDRANTDFFVAGRFWYPVHSRGLSDFSIGGGLGVMHPGATNSSNTTSIEAGAQVRIFVVPNVALTGTVGFGLVSGPTDNWALSGHPLGVLGISYFFF